MWRARHSSKSTSASGHSAFGAVTADRHRSFSLAFGQHAPARFKRASDHVDAAKLNEGFARLERLCRDALGPTTRIRRLVGMRFRQQVHEIEVEDTVVAALEFAAGAVGVLEAATSVYPGFSRRLELTGSQGTIILENDRLAEVKLREPLPDLVIQPPADDERVRVRHRRQERQSQQSHCEHSLPLLQARAAG